MISIDTIRIIMVGTFMGLTAGISPGPILTLVITQTLRYNRTEGIKVALSPLITDFPIILASIFLFSKISELNNILGGISFLGGVFVAYLGYESIKAKGLNIESESSRAGSLKKGITVNFLNPHPYLFWATIGTPYIFRAYEINLMTAILFLISFYTMLVGSKIVVTIIVSRTRAFIGHKLYSVILKFLGIALIIFSLLFIHEGIKYLRQ